MASSELCGGWRIRLRSSRLLPLCTAFVPFSVRLAPSTLSLVNGNTKLNGIVDMKEKCASLRGWLHFKPARKVFTPITEFSGEDVFIVGYPKSSNTWLQNLVAGVVYGVIAEAASFGNLRAKETRLGMGQPDRWPSNKFFYGAAKWAAT